MGKLRRGAGLSDRGRCCASCEASPAPSSGTPPSPSPWRCPACPGRLPPSHCRTTVTGRQLERSTHTHTPTARHGRETHGRHHTGRLIFYLTAPLIHPSLIGERLSTFFFIIARGWITMPTWNPSNGSRLYLYICRVHCIAFVLRVHFLVLILQNLFQDIIPTFVSNRLCLVPAAIQGNVSIPQTSNRLPMPL